MISTVPYDERGYRLLHDGTLALAKIEANGIRIDTDYVTRKLAEIKAEIKEKEAALESTDVVRVWREKYGAKTNLGSGPQLAAVLFDEMGFDVHERTETGVPKVDEDALAHIDDPFVKDFLTIKKRKKGVEKLTEISREVVGEYCHPVFNLHTVLSYRSSCDKPNFQNLPVRNEWLREAVRRCVVARPGRRIVELDFKGIEVSVAACYHHDPTMVKYLRDKTKDMHRDVAMECYLLEQKEVTKDIRYCAKNKFVFPEFYGDWWMSCADALWDAIPQMGLKTTSGVPLLEHLRAQGIKKLGKQDPDGHPKRGTFERHIQEVEDRFWNKRFPVYTQWKKDWYKQYLQRGFIELLSGFVCTGFLDRKQAINYPMQGSAFHCLLRTLVLLQRELKRRRMKALVVGQIHDSVISDVPDEESVEFVEIGREIMSRRIPAEWKWVTVPLEIEAEVGPLDGSWVDKKPLVAA